MPVLLYRHLDQAFTLGWLVNVISDLVSRALRVSIQLDFVYGMKLGRSPLSPCWVGRLEGACRPAFDAARARAPAARRALDDGPG